MYLMPKIAGERKLYKRITKDGVEVMAPYAPDRQEIILSEKEYKQRLF